MQDKTRITIEESRALLHKKREEEWDKLADNTRLYGNYNGQSHIVRYLQIGFASIEELLTILFTAEKECISNNLPNISRIYFDALTTEIMALSRSEHSIVKSTALQQFGETGRVPHEIISRCGINESDRQDSIIRRVKMLREEYKQITASAKTNASNNIVIPAFDFIRHQKLAAILRRDYDEIIRCSEKECWKSMVILCGSSIGGILYDILSQYQTAALASKKAQKSNHGKIPPLEQWSLPALINSAEDLTLIDAGLKGLGDTIMDFHNLVDQVREIDGAYTFTRREAERALSVLDMLIRYLSRKGSSIPAPTLF